MTDPSILISIKRDQGGGRCRANHIWMSAALVRTDWWSRVMSYLWPNRQILHAFMSRDFDCLRKWWGWPLGRHDVRMNPFKWSWHDPTNNWPPGCGQPVEHRVFLLEMTDRDRRERVMAYDDAYMRCREGRTWTSRQPIPGCSFAAGGCDWCQIHRYVTQTLQDDAYCPRSFNGDSLERCLFSEPNRIMCDTCEMKMDFGCGYGFHDCLDCVADNHRSEHVLVSCAECGFCDNPPCVEGNDWPHCRVVCDVPRLDNCTGG
jgi:hypothetical protein